MNTRANTPWLVASLAGATVLLAGLAWKAHAVNPDNGFYSGFGSPSRNASYSFPTSKRVNFRPTVSFSGCNIDTTSVSPSGVYHTFNQDLICGCSNGSGTVTSGTGDGGGGNAITAADDLPYTCINSIGSGIQWGVQITN